MRPLSLSLLFYRKCCTELSNNFLFGTSFSNNWLNASGLRYTICVAVQKVRKNNHNQSLNVRWRIDCSHLYRPCIRYWIMVDLRNFYYPDHATAIGYLPCCSILFVWRLLIRSRHHDVHLSGNEGPYTRTNGAGFFQVSP